MMQVVLVLMAVCAIANADSIEVQGKHYLDVYVLESKQTYSVYRRDGRLLEAISKKRADIGRVSIDDRDPGRMEFIESLEARGQSAPKLKDREQSPTETSTLRDGTPRTLVLKGDPERADASRAATAQRNAVVADWLLERQRVEAEIRLKEEELELQRMKEIEQLQLQHRAIEAHEMRTQAQFYEAQAMQNSASALNNAADSQRRAASAVRELAREVHYHSGR